MDDGAPPDLTGRWAPARLGGLLPPSGTLHARIDGAESATHLGHFRGPLSSSRG